MASVKVKFRASQVEGREGVIYYQIIHERVVRQVKSSHKVFANEWNESCSEVVASSQEDVRIAYISTIGERIKIDINRLAQIIKTLSHRGAYSAKDVVQTFERQIMGVTLRSYMQSAITRLADLRRYRTSETYKTTLNSFMRFRDGEDLLLTDISSDMMMDYEVYLKSEGLVNNSISFYMRILRAVYNRAVEDQLVEQKFPFKKVYTGVDKTVKRALPLKYIKQIKELDLTTQADLTLSRDLFMMSFYLRGMSFIDMAFLRKNSLQNGTVSYRRRKTGQQLHIKWEPCMQEILDHHPHFDTEYLLPIIRRPHKDDRTQYRNALCLTNRKLKRIGEMTGLSTPLTHYVARHSWASVAKSCNIPIAVISEALGHDSETTTQIYLSSLDSSVVDNANNLILKLL